MIIILCLGSLDGLSAATVQTSPGKTSVWYNLFLPITVKH